MKKFIIPPRLHLKMKKDMKNFQSSAELETAPQKSCYANLSQTESILGNNTELNQSVANAYIPNLQPFLKVSQAEIESYLKNVANGHLNYLEMISTPF